MRNEGSSVAIWVKGLSISDFESHFKYHYITVAVSKPVNQLNHEFNAFLSFLISGSLAGDDQVRITPSLRSRKGEQKDTVELEEKTHD